MSNMKHCTALNTGNHCFGMTHGNPLAVMRRGRHGFTLIELMFAVFVLVILVTMALPSYRSFMAGQRVKNASFDAVSALSRARSEAITRNANVNITPNGGDWRQGWAVAAGSIILLQQPAQSIRIAANDASTSTGFASRCVGVDPSGRPRSMNGSCT